MEKDFSEKSYFHKACGIIKFIVAKSTYVCQATPMFLLLLSAICPDMNISYSLGDSLLH